MSAPLTLAGAHRRGFELVDRHVRRFVAHVRALPADNHARPIPGSDWTVAQTVVHVHSVIMRYTIDLRRAATPDEVGAQNAEDLDRLGDDVDAALAGMEEQLQLLPMGVDMFTPEQPLPFHAGQDITLAGGWGNLLGELLAHGDDLGRATGTPFTIPGEDLEILWRFTAPVLHGWLHATTTDGPERWRLAFPFGELDLVIDGGTFLVEPGAPVEPDHRIEITDVADFTLAFPYGRRAPDDDLVAILASRFAPL